MALGAAAADLFSRLALALRSLAVFVLIAGSVYAIGRFAAVPTLARAADAVDLDETLRLPLLKVTGAAFAVTGVYLAIPLSGLATTPTTVAAISAGATIAIGFASRDVLSNLVSGAFIVLDPEFHIGDWIEWNDRSGVIEDVSFRVTRVHTFDNELVTVPNSELTANAVTNPAAKDRRRVTHEFGVGYGDDLDRVRRLLLDAAVEHEDVLDRPTPRAPIVELGESAVVFRAQFWVADPARMELQRIRSEYVQAAKERFDAAGVEMPYPYRELTGEVGHFEAAGPDER